MKAPRIIVFPLIEKGNPYQVNFYRPLKEAGWDVRDWGLFRPVLPGELLHVHWPEAWAWTDGWGRLVRLLFIGLLPILKCVFGLRVLNTVHNLKPHDGFSRIGRWVYDRTLNACDVFIHLSEAGKCLFLENRPEFSEREHVVIPHPDYRPQLSDMSRINARAVLALKEEHERFVFFGGIRPNKGLERLIASFREYDNMNASLWIGGRCSPGVECAIYESIVDDHRIEFVSGFIDETDLEVQVKAADLVVLPYTSGLNSGVIFYALSCGAHVLVPDTEVFREVDRLIGGGRVSFFGQDQFTAEFKRILKSSRVIHPNPVDLDALFGPKVQLKLLDFFASLRNSS